MPAIHLNWFDFYEKGEARRAWATCKRLRLKYPRFEVSRTRIVFLSTSCVFKFPLNDEGVAANDWEGSSACDVYARSRWVLYKGFVCCMMQRVTPLDFTDYLEVPDWVRGIDCGQVGHTRKGKLVAYDYALG